MNLFRLSGVCLAVLLTSACDKEPPTPPKAPTPVPPSVSAPVPPSPAAEPVKSTETPEPEQAAQPAPVSKPVAKPEPAPKAVTQKPSEPKVVVPKTTSVSSASEAAKADKAKADAPKTVVRPPQPPEKIQRLQVNKPQTAQQRKSSETVKKQKLEKPKLDLHLPKDLVNKLEPEVAGEKGEGTATTLLPPMFVEKPAQQSSFEMGGRLITNEHSRDLDKDASYWDTVDGAELQFKFNH